MIRWWNLRDLNDANAPWFLELLDMTKTVTLLVDSSYFPNGQPHEDVINLLNKAQSRGVKSITLVWGIYHYGQWIITKDPSSENFSVYLNWWGDNYFIPLETLLNASYPSMKVDMVFLDCEVFPLAPAGKRKDDWLKERSFLYSVGYYFIKEVFDVNTKVVWYGHSATIWTGPKNKRITGSYQWPYFTPEDLTDAVNPIMMRMQSFKCDLWALMNSIPKGRVPGNNVMPIVWLGSAKNENQIDTRYDYDFKNINKLRSFMDMARYDDLMLYPAPNRDVEGKENSAWILYLKHYLKYLVI